MNGRRRSQYAPSACASSGLVEVSGACNPPDNSQPTECDYDCARVFLPYWESCGAVISQSLPQIARLLTPMVPMCANPTGFNEHAEETGPPLVARPAKECPPEPTCPVDGPNACGDLWGAYHVCVMDRVNDGGTGTIEPPPHICGDDCDGEWHLLDERMGSRRAVRLINPSLSALARRRALHCVRVHSLCRCWPLDSVALASMLAQWRLTATRTATRKSSSSAANLRTGRF